MGLERKGSSVFSRNRLEIVDQDVAACLAAEVGLFMADVLVAAKLSRLMRGMSVTADDRALPIALQRRASGVGPVRR